ncbi:MAG: GAF domain-containing protein [Dehalococcoidales bacterium]
MLSADLFYNSVVFVTFPRGFFKINNKRIFAIIREINEALSLTNEPEKLVNAALDALSQTLKVECCWIQTVSEGKNQPLTLAAERGFSAEMKSEIAAMGPNHGFSGRIVGMGQKIVIPDFSRDGVYGLDSFKKAGYRWLVAVPLLTYRVYGILGTASRNRRILRRETAELEMVVAGMIASALSKVHLSRGFPLRKKPQPPSVPETREDTPQKEKEAPAAPSPASTDSNPPQNIPPKHTDTAFHAHTHKMHSFRKTHR